jgi:hypothetical protein
VGYQLQISAKFLSWPRQCACCGEAADTHIHASASRITETKRTKRTETQSWEVPYCSKCSNHKTKYEAANNWTIAGLIAWLVVWVFIGNVAGTGAAGFILGGLLFGGSFIPYSQAKNEAAAMMKQSCCTAGTAVQYVGWHGTMHTFVFQNKPYLESFIALNAKKTRSEIRQI